MPSKNITIAIVDDHQLFRQGLRSLLSEFPEITIVFDAANGEELKERISRLPVPEVVLMDINMPVLNGYDATSWLRHNHPDVNVLALSMFEDEKPIIRMLKNGAGGYMLKESKIADVVNAIKIIAEQGFYINELVSAKLLRNIQGLTDASHRLSDHLSANEIKFLQLCCSELTYKEIAAQMHLSPHTIDNYRQELFQKFSIKSRTGLALFAIRNELITLT
jgi:DNA-binding NarL/FixJ family response regulator